MIAPEVWPFGQAEPYGEGIPGMRMVLAKFRGRIHTKGMSEQLNAAWELGCGILGETEAGWDRGLGEVGIRVSGFGNAFNWEGNGAVENRKGGNNRGALGRLFSYRRVQRQEGQEGQWLGPPSRWKMTEAWTLRGMRMKRRRKTFWRKKCEARWLI